MRLRQNCPLCGSPHFNLLYPSTLKKKDLNATVFSARRLPDRVHGSVIRCSKCGLVRTLEIISELKLKQLYSKSHFTYESLTSNLVKTYSPLIRRAAKRLKTKRAFLEIGCGNGFMLEEAKKIGFSKVFGIEPSRHAVEQANNSIKKEIVVDMLRPGLFPARTFDLIAAFQVFDHIAEPNNFLKNCYNFLAPGGILLLMNHDVEAISAKILREKNPIVDIEHPYLYSQKTISQILEKNGFSVLDVFSPPTIFSLGHLFHLLPIPKLIKQWLLSLDGHLISHNISLRPGNLCVYARKN